MNSVNLIGHLGQDPTTYFGSEGDAMTSFSIAFNSGKDKTSWIKCVCFNKTAEIAEKYLHTGDRIAVSGYLKQNTWTTDQNEKRSNYEIIVNNIEFIKIKEEAQF